MSTIRSKIESIDNLWFEPITAKVISVSKLTRVDGIIVALGTDGKIYTNEVIGHVAYAFGDSTGRLSRVLDGCIKLKALSAGAVRQHKEDVAKLQAERDFEWNSEQLQTYAERLGITLNEAQLSKVHKDHARRN